MWPWNPPIDLGKVADSMSGELHHLFWVYADDPHHARWLHNKLHHQLQHPNPASKSKIRDFSAARLEVLRLAGRIVAPGKLPQASRQAARRVSADPDALTSRAPGTEALLQTQEWLHQLAQKSPRCTLGYLLANEFGLSSKEVAEVMGTAHSTAKANIKTTAAFLRRKRHEGHSR